MSPVKLALVEVLDRTFDASSPEAIPEFGDLGMADYQIRQLVQRILSHCRSIGITTTAVLARTEGQPDDDGKSYRLALARLLNDVSAEYSEPRRVRRCEAGEARRRVVRLTLGWQSSPLTADAAWSPMRWPSEHGDRRCRVGGVNARAAHPRVPQA